MGSFSSIFGAPPLKVGTNVININLAAGARYIPPLGWYFWHGQMSVSGYYKHSIYDSDTGSWLDSYSTIQPTMQIILSDGAKAAILNVYSSAINIWLMEIIRGLPSFSFGPKATAPSDPWNPPADGYGYMFINTDSSCAIVCRLVSSLYWYGFRDAGGGIISGGQFNVRHALEYLKSDNQLMGV